MEHNSKKAKKRKPRQSEAQAAGFEAVAMGALIGSGGALVCMLALALISAALCMLSPDPASLSMPIGLAILYISSALGGALSSKSFKGELSSALTASGMCGFVLFVLTGICSVLQGLLAPEASHGFGLPTATLLRVLAVAVSMLSACIFCKVRQKKRKAYRHKR